MHTNDEIDVLFNAAGQESKAIDALDAAVTQLKAARDAKARLARFAAPQLRAGLLRRSDALGGDRA